MDYKYSEYVDDFEYGGHFLFYSSSFSSNSLFKSFLKEFFTGKKW